MKPPADKVKLPQVVGRGGEANDEPLVDKVKAVKEILGVAEYRQYLESGSPFVSRALTIHQISRLAAQICHLFEREGDNDK